jgi:deazaflavin-dependent oxidoreductase (nitroreductase family)
MTSATRAARRPPAWAAGFNRFALSIAGHRWFPLYAVVEHRGRKSGQAYEVPIALIATPSQFLICLPFGRSTNWARNVIAADGCDVRWTGGVHHVTAPRLVGQDVALPLANRFERVLIRRLGFEDFLLLQP